MSSSSTKESHKPSLFNTKKDVRRSKTCGDLNDDNGHSNRIRHTLLNEDGKYVGEVSGTKRHGRGVQTNALFRFEGEFHYDKPHGWGKKVFTSGDRHEGTYVNGKREGWGQYLWCNGDKYTGNYKEGKMHGKGTFHWANGGSYVGQWRNGFIHGYGVRVDIVGDQIEGHFVNGQAHGWANKHFGCGDEYKGFFYRDRRAGYGLYNWASNGLAEGHWQPSPDLLAATPAAATTLPVVDALSGSEVLHGLGVFLSGSSSTTHSVGLEEATVGYRGHFQYGIRVGLGEGFSGDGTTYSGGWLGGLKHGWGRQCGPGREDGTVAWVYDGDFLNNMRHGQGMLVWADESTYTGEWANDLAHGTGCQRFLDSGVWQEYSGSFKEGLRHGQGILRVAGLPDRSGVWEEGLPV